MEIIELYNAHLVARSDADVAAGPGEQDHYAASRFTPPSWPFTATRVRYRVFNYAPASADLDHQIVLFTEPGEIPSAVPMEKLRQPVSGIQDGIEPEVEFDVPLARPVVVPEGHHLYVAVQMKCMPAYLALRTSQVQALPRRCYWSASPAPPYDWYDIEDLGYGVIIMVVEGQLGAPER